MNTLLPYAIEYAEQGLSVMPLSGKRPLGRWEYYMKHRATPRQINLWWKKHKFANVGIITGKVSELIVVDFDYNAELIYPQALPIVQTAVGDNFIVSKTGKGYHIIVRTKSETIRNTKIALKGKKGRIETRGNGGYIVAPPSIHPDTGNQYQWTNGKRIGNLERVDSLIIDRLLDDLRDAFHEPDTDKAKTAVCAPREYSDEKVVVEDIERFRENLVAKQTQRVAMAGEGNRHATLISASGILAQFGVDEGRIYEVMYAASNANGYLSDYGNSDVGRSVRWGINNAELIKVEEDPFIGLGIELK